MVFNLQKTSSTFFEFCDTPVIKTGVSQYFPYVFLDKNAEEIFLK